MLSMTARPKSSGPVSVPSSKIIVIESTVPVMGHGPPGGTVHAELNPITGDHRRRCHAVPEVTVGGGELHPTKKNPLLVATLKRGAPAPQCEPLGAVFVVPGFRRS